MTALLVSLAFLFGFKIGRGFRTIDRLVRGRK